MILPGLPADNCRPAFAASRSQHLMSPVHFPLRRDAAILSRVRSEIISRSN